ncbi:MAG: hypothetical protein ACXAEU_18020 [Candidatus Hodarchaeales archaeon]|jgi:hypothetical protein
MSLITLISGMSEVISGIVFLITAFFVLKKDPKYDLNRLVALAVLFFSIVLMSEGLMYMLQSTDTIIINLIRDITELSGILAGSCILLAGVEVNKGKVWRSLRVIIPVLVVAFIGIFAILFHDVFYVTIGDSIFYYYEGRYFWVFFLVSGIPIVELPIGIYLFNLVRKEVKETDSKVARKMLYLQTGMFCIMVSAAFLVIVLTVLVPAGVAPNLFLVIAGQVGYLVSSVLLFIAFKQ